MSSCQVLAILIIGLCSSAVSASALRPRPCPGGITGVQELAVSSDGEACTRFPCSLYKGKYTTISLKVTTSKDVSAGVPKVSGVVGGIPLPWSVPAADGFPVTAKDGDTWSYTMKFLVSSAYPSIRSPVTWQVLDANSEKIFCFKIAVMLKTRN